MALMVPSTNPPLSERKRLYVAHCDVASARPTGASPNARNARNARKERLPRVLQLMLQAPDLRQALSQGQKLL